MLYIAGTQPLLTCSILFSTDTSPEVLHKNRGVSESASYAGDIRKPDIIVIDADDQKKMMEGLHRLKTPEGKQASSMLRMLASGGSGKLEKLLNLEMRLKTVFLLTLNSHVAYFYIGFVFVLFFKPLVCVLHA